MRIIDENEKMQAFDRPRMNTEFQKTLVDRDFDTDDDPFIPARDANPNPKHPDLLLVEAEKNRQFVTPALTLKSTTKPHLT